MRKRFIKNSEIQFKTFLVWVSAQDAARIVKTASQKEEKENAAESARKIFEIRDIALVASR